MKLKEAVTLAGGRSITTKNSKMPGSSFSGDPHRCNVGQRLHKIKGSTCAACYSLKLTRMRPSVRIGYARNEDALRAAAASKNDDWVAGMAYQINRQADKSGVPLHRWFDGGDLYSDKVLHTLVQVAERTPEVDHWIPTREAAIVRQYSRQIGGLQNLPENLIVRVSSAMVDGPPRDFPWTSTVHKKSEPHGHQCMAEARTDANGVRIPAHCGDCTACWDKSVANVSYKYKKG